MTDPRQPDPAWDDADGMCPNCITPWKCNGPHLNYLTLAGLRHRDPRQPDPDPRMPDDWLLEPPPTSGAVLVYVVGAAAIVLAAVVAWLVLR
jgi:hypothetical protein